MWVFSLYVYGSVRKVCFQVLCFVFPARAVFSVRVTVPSVCMPVGEWLLGYVLWSVLCVACRQSTFVRVHVRPRGWHSQICEQVGLHCVSLCVGSCKGRHSAPPSGASGVLGGVGVYSCSQHLRLWDCVSVVFPGQAGILRPSEAPGASVLRGGCACGMSPCWLVPRWLRAGCGRQGRAGAVVGTGPTPGPRYKYPRLPSAVFTRPQSGGGSSPAGPGGGDDQATAQTLPSGQTGHSLPVPRLSLWVGARQQPLRLGFQGPPGNV